MTNIIVTLLYENKLIKKDEIDSYRFCLNYIFEYTVFICTSLIIGAIFNLLIPMALFLTVFLSLRAYGGGYHAASHKKCIIYSGITILTFCISQMLISSYWNCVCSCCINIIYILSCILYIIMVPVVPHNKHLHDREHLEYRYNGIITCLIICIFYILFLLCNQPALCMTICFGNAISTISLLILRKGREHNES